MHNIYEIAYEWGYSNNQKTLKVFAKDAKQAIENTLRYAKKNFSSEIKIISVQKQFAVDVYYKS